MGNQRKINPFIAQNELSMLSATVSVQVNSQSDAFITISVPKRRGFWPAVMLFFQYNNFEVISATLSTSVTMNFHCIHAQIPEGSDIDSEELRFRLEALVMEELGIQAFRA